MIGKIYLCRPDGALLGVLDGVDEESCRLKQSVADLWELSFDVVRYMERDGELVESDYYSSIEEMMELYLDGDVQGRFQIDATPSINDDGTQEKKNVVAHSIEVELQTKFLRSFKINTGLTESQENLVGFYDDNGEFVSMNLNPYTNLPIDYINVTCTLGAEMEELLQELNGVNLRVDASTGLIGNTDVYPLLRSAYEDYPRLSCDVQADGSNPRIYLNVIDNPSTAIGYEVYVGRDYSDATASYSASWLLNGIKALIAYYEEYGSQLSMIDLAIENAKAAGWSVGEIPKDIAKKKYTFTADNQDLLSFLKTTVTQTMKVIVDFDRVNRKVNIIDIVSTDEEHDTGVFLTYRNLVNEVDVKTSSNEGMRTRFYPTGQNNLGILYANFGLNYITDLDWLIDKVNEYGDRQYVSEELHDKYHAWKKFREEEPVTVLGVEYESRRDAYRELTKLYNQTILDVNEIQNLLPADGCYIDFTTFPFADLNVAYKAYMNALEAIEQLYESDVNAVTFNRSTQEAYDYNGNLCTPISETWYWHDWDCYYNTIIPNVLNALKMYVLTDANGNLDPSDPTQYDMEKGEWIEYPGGNPWYNGDASRVTENVANLFQYDMSLFGTIELAAKKQAWVECAATLYKPGFVLSKSSYKVVDPVPLDGYIPNTADDAGWARLSTEQQEAFSNENAFIKALNEYLDYTDPNVRDNQLTKAQTKGVIQMAQDAIDALQPSIDAIIAKQDDIDAARKEIADAVTMESWDFTELELQTLYTMIRESDYSNTNILTTNLDDIVTTVDAQETLYQDAVTALAERARPQLSFEVKADNLFALEDFAMLRDDVDLLNYIRISIGLYRDEFVKLRIVEIERNPLIPDDDLEMGFSNMTYSLQGVTDFAALFESLNGGTSSGGTAVSSSSTSGTGYGANDAEIEIANNMLNALLKSKSFTLAASEIVVNQVVNTEEYRTLLVQSGIFDRLETGEFKVSGDCFFDYVKSSNYNGTKSNPLSNTEGSYLGIKEGIFNFGGGKLTWNGSALSITAEEIMFNAPDGTTEDVSDYKKTATNHLYYSPSTGLIVGETTAASSVRNPSYSSYVSGYNTQITGSAINFRNKEVNMMTLTGAGVRIYESSNLMASFLASGVSFYNSAGTNMAFFGTESGVPSARIGSSTAFNTLILGGNSKPGIYFRNKSAELMKITVGSDGKADIDTTGVYKINGKTVMTQEDMNVALSDNFYIKTVNMLDQGKTGDQTIIRIKAGKTKSLYGSCYQSGYTAVGIVGYNVFNVASNGCCSLANIYGLMLSGNNQITCKMRNLAGSTKSNVYLNVSVLMVKNEITINYNSGGDDEDEDDNTDDDDNKS